MYRGPILATELIKNLAFYDNRHADYLLYIIYLVNILYNLNAKIITTG